LGGTLGLAHAAGRNLKALHDDVGACLGRRFVDTNDLIVVEVALLDAPVLERDLAILASENPITAAPSICERMPPTDAYAR